MLERWWELKARDWSRANRQGHYHAPGTRNQVAYGKKKIIYARWWLPVDHAADSSSWKLLLAAETDRTTTAPTVVELQPDCKLQCH